MLRRGSDTQPLQECWPMQSQARDTRTSTPKSLVVGSKNLANLPTLRKIPMFPSPSLPAHMVATANTPPLAPLPRPPHTFPAGPLTTLKNLQMQRSRVRREEEGQSTAVLAQAARCEQKLHLTTTSEWMLLQLPPLLSRVARVPLRIKLQITQMPSTLLCRRTTPPLARASRKRTPDARGSTFLMNPRNLVCLLPHGKKKMKISSNAPLSPTEKSAGSIVVAAVRRAKAGLGSARRDPQRRTTAPSMKKVAENTGTTVDGRASARTAHGTLTLALLSLKAGTTRKVTASTSIASIDLRVWTRTMWASLRPSFATTRTTIGVGTSTRKESRSSLLYPNVQGLILELMSSETAKSAANTNAGRKEKVNAMMTLHPSCPAQPSTVRRTKTRGAVSSRRFLAGPRRRAWYPASPRTTAASTTTRNESIADASTGAPRCRHRTVPMTMG
ncbi:hypothetical protein HDK64DRAFT_277800 [Phyllosticta capitalensis]